MSNEKIELACLFERLPFGQNRWCALRLWCWMYRVCHERQICRSSLSKSPSWITRRLSSTEHRSSGASRLVEKDQLGKTCAAWCSRSTGYIDSLHWLESRSGSWTHRMSISLRSSVSRHWTRQIGDVARLLSDVSTSGQCTRGHHAAKARSLSITLDHLEHIGRRIERRELHYGRENVGHLCQGMDFGRERRWSANRYSLPVSDFDTCFSKLSSMFLRSQIIDRWRKFQLDRKSVV